MVVFIAKYIFITSITFSDRADVFLIAHDSSLVQLVSVSRDFYIVCIFVCYQKSGSFFLLCISLVPL